MIQDSTIKQYFEAEHDIRLDAHLDKERDEDTLLGKIKIFYEKDRARTAKHIEVVKDIAKSLYRSLCFKMEKNYSTIEREVEKDGVRYIVSNTVPFYESKKIF